MKLVVVGRGLAAMGLLWELGQGQKERGKDLFSEILWVGAQGLDHGPESPEFCALNSTAVIARQGIEKGVSPLGDLLYESYDHMVSFIKKFRPEGVLGCERFHLLSSKAGGKEAENLEKRFGPLGEHRFQNISLGPSIREESYFFTPQIFLSWWEREIRRSLPQIKLLNDWVIDLTHEHVKTLFSGDLSYHKVALCCGALGSVFPHLSFPPNQNMIPKQVSGHYARWDGVQFDEWEGEKSFILTWAGHNMVYNHEERSIVWGGTTHNDGILAPREEELSFEMNSLLSSHPQFSFSGQYSLRTGIRSKGQRRRPLFKVSEDRRKIWVNALYKNGYTVSLTYGKWAQEEFFELGKGEKNLENGGGNL